MLEFTSWDLPSGLWSYSLTVLVHRGFNMPILASAGRKAGMLREINS